MDIGSGDEHPIVFIHGLGGQWQNWLENIPRFAQDRRVIVPDLPGFGLSPMPAEEISIAYYGRVVADLCDALGLGPARGRRQLDGRLHRLRGGDRARPSWSSG